MLPWPFTAPAPGARLADPWIQNINITCYTYVDRYCKSEHGPYLTCYKAVSVRCAPRNVPQAPPSGSQCYESLNRYAEDTLRISKVVIALLEDKSWRQMLKGRLMKTETESKG